MSATIWTPNAPASTANADGSYKSQSFAVSSPGTNGTLQFTLGTFQYAPGTGSLMVFVNGSKQSLSKTPTPDFTEDSPTQFTINSNLRVGDFVEAYALVGGSATQSAAASAAIASAAATAALGYLTAIQALTPPSLPLSVANGGTGGTTKPTVFNNLAPTASKGDLIVYNGANNIALPAAADGWILTPDSTAAAGLRYRPAKPMLIGIGALPVTYGVNDAGSLKIASVPTSAGMTVTIDGHANLYTGWFIFIENGSSGGTSTAGVLTISLTGADTFRGNTTTPGTIGIPIGGCVGIHCDGAGIFTIFASAGSRGYLKVRDQQATGVSKAAPTLGLNTRIFNTVIDNTFPGTAPLASSPYIGLVGGTYQFKVTTVHTGAAATRLGIYTSVGSALLQSGPNNPPSNFVNTFTGRLTTISVLLFVQEWFSAATGTLGGAINDGNPEIYAEAEFWRE